MTKENIDFIKANLGNWMEEQNIIPFRNQPQDYSPQIMERIVRVEEQLKHQNENIKSLIKSTDSRFEQMQNYMDRRFDDVNQRFEDMNRRFDRMGLYHLATFTAIIGSAVAILMQT